MDFDNAITALHPDAPDDGDEGRRQRGMAIAALVPIEKKQLGYKVPSQSGNGAYIVNVDNEALCSCPDFEKRAAPCKHIYAVWMVGMRQVTPNGGVVETRAVGVTYAQDWPAYNAAQTHEKEHFLTLLKGLCDTVEPEEQHMGRPRLPMGDMAFANALRVYSTMSGRRGMENQREAERLQLIDRAPSFNSLFRYMNDPAMTPVLENLITRSALPLRGLESHFSTDSTGFSTSLYSSWFDHKYGRFKKAENWVKAHAMSGANTHIVTAVAVTGQDVNDSPMLKPLLDVTAANFDVQQVSADKAYLSRANLWEIHERGAAAFIPFKSNSVVHRGDAPLDALWNQAYHHFQLHRELFLEQYHMRSNV